jgi:hypothetical protein
MPMPKIISLPIAIRVYPEPNNAKERARSEEPWTLPPAMLVFDTETRIDARQSLTFGSYRFIVAGRCLEEVLFHGDDLPKRDLRTLERYLATHRPDVAGEGFQQMRLLTRAEFVNRLYEAVYKGRCLLVALNLPFDLSRIAYDSTTARGRFAGGFSLGLWTYADKDGREFPNPYRPRIGIKQIDSKRALKGFTARNNPDNSDLIPEGSGTDKPKRGYIFRGHMLDLRTLAFALTDKGYSLETACEDFRVEHGKQPVLRHGTITENYIDYNRRDVLATSELAPKLLEEYSKHPITLQPTKAYSAAAIGKAYLFAMGIAPVLDRQPDFPQEHVGYAQSAFYGGRTSAHIRKVVVPVVYTDFLSMYPTVNSLMGLWRFVIAREIKVIEHCGKEIERFLRGIRPSDLFEPRTWQHLPAFVKIIPDGDILPCRARYSLESNDWQVGVNHLHAGSKPNDGLWFSLPDVVASVLLSARIPKIIDAFRIAAHGTCPDLKPVKLRGAIEIDPKTQDFFKVVIEERKRLWSRGDLTELERKRLDKALKVLANAASYGIYAEMIRQESERKVNVTCHGIDAEPYHCRVLHPEEAGEYCFPPFASLITGAARLMLALLEHCVSELGGSYAMEDTDSMAIVATEHGGMIPCPGGPHQMPDGLSVVKALTWKQVRRISTRFAALSPYDRDAIPGSILKIEDDNFDPATKKQRQVWCLAISAKRYALFLRDEKGIPTLLRKRVNNEDDRWSEHGLGHLLNPSDPEGEDREWIAQAWLNIVRNELRLSREKLGFQDLPAVGRVTVSSPFVLKAFAHFNEGKPYWDQIKPFNFLLTCHVNQFGHPIGADPEHFHLIAPYESDPGKWLNSDWFDQYTGKRYRITTADDYGTRQTARVKTYGEILREYEFHPESKCADADGKPSGKQTVGLLQRRHIQIDEIKCIGKESNSLEDVESGLIHSSQNVYTEYPDSRRDEWETKIRPALSNTPLSRLVKMSGLSRRMLINARTGRTRPHRKNQELLAGIVRTPSAI